MPSLYIDACCQIKSILMLTDFGDSHNWLVSYLDCYDTVGWNGSSKWKNTSLILTDEELKKDIYSRNMVFIWGVFSAIPDKYSHEEILSYTLPTLETPHYMHNSIAPQHPLSPFEISVWDGSYTYITAHDEATLKPFFSLPYRITDTEADNRIMNAELCRIRDMLRALIPDVSDVIANEIQWKCWHALFRGKSTAVSDKQLKKEICKAYAAVSTPGYHLAHGTVIWNPYDQK